jgi:dihydropteroate synthase type 2
MSAVRTRVLGIVNVTEDSFSDGGRFLAPDAALAHARGLLDAGADAVDLGPASSHPDGKVVDVEEERRRLGPILAPLVADGAFVSVDSWRPEVQQFAVAHGARMVNDIRGFPDHATRRFLADHDCWLVAMFSLDQGTHARRVDADPTQVLEAVVRFFDLRLAELDADRVRPDRVIVDPGMGFFLGNNPQASIAVLRAIPELRRRWGRPVLVSVSRKSFLRAIAACSVDEAGPPTLAAELYAARHGVDWIRTHDVRALRDALAVEAALDV